MQLTYQPAISCYLLCFLWVFVHKALFHQNSISKHLSNVRLIIAEFLEIITQFNRVLAAVAFRWLCKVPMLSCFFGKAKVEHLSPEESGEMHGCRHVTVIALYSVHCRGVKSGRMVGLLSLCVWCAFCNWMVLLHYILSWVNIFLVKPCIVYILMIHNDMSLSDMQTDSYIKCTLHQ